MDGIEQWMVVMQNILQLLGPNPYVQAVAIIVISLILAKVVYWLLGHVGAGWARRTQTDLDDHLLALLHRPVFVSVMLFGLALATRRLDLPEPLAWVTIAMLKTMVILVWVAFLKNFASLFLDFLSRRQERFPLVRAQTLPLLKNVVMVVLLGAAVYFLFLSWNIDVTAWLASAGIIGIALSFAAKDTLANLFAGVFILADAPYKVGDFVVLDSGERGRVTHIGIRSTRILTRDDIEITIPNAIMGNTKITNESGGPHEGERIRIQVSVAYGSDIGRVRTVLLEVAEAHPQVRKEPEPRVRFRAFGDSGLEVELLCWIEEPVLRGRVQDALNTQVYNSFMQEGIEIPYPKRDVFIRHMQRVSAE